MSAVQINLHSYLYLHIITAVTDEVRSLEVHACIPDFLPEDPCRLNRKEERTPSFVERIT